MGFIFQFYNLLPTLTAAENVALPLLIDGKRLERLRRRLDRAAGPGGPDRPPATTSPTSSPADSSSAWPLPAPLSTSPRSCWPTSPPATWIRKSGTAVLELLRKTCKELNATMVMVTHDPRAASYADRVVFLKDGQIVDELPTAKPGQRSPEDC